MVKAHSYDLEEAPVDTKVSVEVAGAEKGNFLTRPGLLNRLPGWHPANEKHAILVLGAHR
jgi:hypothetical protein